MRALLLAALLCMACEGPQGPAGPQGEQGPQGPLGADSGLKSEAFCKGSISLGNYSIFLDHTAYAFGDGSVLATCTVLDSGVEFPNVFMFRASQVGSVSASCLIPVDADTPSGGFWDFEMSSNRAISTVTYLDSSSPYNGKTTTLLCDRY